MRIGELSERGGASEDRLGPLGHGRSLLPGERPLPGGQGGPCEAASATSGTVGRDAGVAFAQRPLAYCQREMVQVAGPGLW